MSDEYFNITPEELIESADPKQSYDWLARAKLACEQAIRMRVAGHESVCVASTIAFTHYGIVGNFDFSRGVSNTDLRSTEDRKGISAQVAELAGEKVEVRDFHSMEPLDKGKLQIALDKIHSAWVSIVPSIKIGGHTWGVIPGRHAKEFIVWDSSGDFPILSPVTVDGILEKITQDFKESSFYIGTIFSFKGR